MFVAYVAVAFGLTASKLLHPNYFSTKGNLNYVGPIPDVSLYGVIQMSSSERREFLAW
jgi:hypothetical protein